MYRNCREGVESFYNLECFWYARYFLFLQAGPILLLSSAHLLKEGNEGHEAVIIFRFTKFLHQTLGLLLGKFLSKVGKETEKFISNHGVVVVFVIKLKDFNEVMEATLVLACLVHGEDLSLGEGLLSLLRLSSNFLNSPEG